jgi:hypothetical protein
VGIGTPTPSFKLDILGTVGPRARVISQDDYFAGLLTENNTHQYFVGTQATYESASGTNSGFQIYDNTVGARRMVIDANGNMGIGTSAPDYSLDVAGNINSDGLYLNNDKLVTNDGFGRVEFFNHIGQERMEFNGSNINIQNATLLIQQSLKIGTGTSSPAATLEVDGTTRITDLSGTGNRMVVTDVDGDLSTQAIVTGITATQASAITTNTAKLGVTFVYHTPSIVGPLPAYDGSGNYATNYVDSTF